MPGSAPSLIGGRFVLEVEHRRGGMGSVWRGREIGSDRLVAIKLLQSFGDAQRARFERECALLSDLRHPNIVRYLDHGTSLGGVPFLAMEWLDGETVADRLARQRLTVGQSLALIESTLRGLDAAHARGVLHRDLKPSNLFLRDGSLDDVILLDLGLARHVEDNDGLTRTGAVLGTASYMAPEQAQARGELTAAVDFFALGAILFECLTGAPPFVGTQLLAVLAKLLFEPPPRLRALRPELPEALEELVDGLLEKEPARRLRRSEELRQRLAALAACAPLGVPSSAPAPSSSPSRPSDAEQELVSVILALPPADATAAPDDPDATLVGERHEQLADGSTIITLAQRGGAATDLAARAARRALRASDARPGWSFAVATGRGMLSERSHIGEAADRAATMLRAREREAPPAIWLDEVTAGLLDARFRTSPLNEGIVAFVLEGEDASIDPERRLLGRPTPCVGREHELGILELTLAACVEEPGPRAVLVLGPPGSGKSRLRHELERRARARGLPFQQLLGLADPNRTATTLGLLGSALARSCGIRAGASAEEGRRRLVDAAGATLGGRAELEFLALLAGVEPDEGVPELRRARQDPRLMSSWMARAWLELLRAECERQPVLLVLDDLQWADAASLSLVERALRELSSSRLMVLGLGRPELSELYPGLWGPAVTSVPLRPLGATAMARLVRQMLGDAASDAAVQRIVTRAAGNALYLEELIRAAHARREAVPETVLAMLQARIGLLSPRARRVLRAASVFGETFPLTGAAALLGADDASELEPLLSTLARDEVLEADESGQQRWRFRHALLRDAAYSLLTPEDRDAAHASVARFLEAAADDPAVIAQHFERAGDRVSAVRHFTSAALRAYRANDLDGAIALVQRGIDAGAAGPERGLLRSLSAPALFQSWRFADAWAATSEALALLPPGDPRRVISITWHAVSATQRGDWDEVEAHIPELLASVPAEPDRVEFGTALSHAVIAYTGAGHREHSQRFVDWLGRLGADLGPENPFAYGLAGYARARLERFLGEDPFLALDLGESAARSYEPTGHFLFPYMLVDAGECRRRVGDVQGGITLMREALEGARVCRAPVTFAYVQQFLAGALAEHGSEAQVQEAGELLDAFFATASSGNVFHALAQIARSSWCARSGELERAEREAAEAYATLRRLRMRGYYPHALLPLLRARAQLGAADAVASAVEAEALLDGVAPVGILDQPLRIAVAQAFFVAPTRLDDARRAAAAARASLERRVQRAPDAARREAFLALPEHLALQALEHELVRVERAAPR